MDLVKENPRIAIAFGASLCAIAIHLAFFYEPKECPLTRMIICTRTPFHDQVRYDLSQAEKERCARSWMENYVRSVLLSRVPPGQEHAVEDGPMRNIEQLRQAIATEKGLLKEVDFDHVQKVIEVYSKVLLCETRKNHMAERAPTYNSRNWAEYQQQVLTQQQGEIKIFNKATMEILAIANIKTSVFNQSVELFMLANEETVLLKSACLSFFSPFVVTINISATKCRALLSEASKSALKYLREMRLAGTPSSELLLYFDNLFCDYVNAQGVDVDQFRSACFKYCLQEEETTVGALA